MAKDTTTAPTVSANPAMVEFPRDQWGFTSELRKAGLRACQGVRGNDEKHAVLIATMRVLALHATARLPVDAQALKDRAQQIADRAESQRSRVASHGVNTAEIVVQPVTAEMIAVYEG